MLEKVDDKIGLIAEGQVGLRQEMNRGFYGINKKFNDLRGEFCEFRVEMNGFRKEMGRIQKRYAIKF